jgi:hypothetical protein
MHVPSTMRTDLSDYPGTQGFGYPTYVLTLSEDLHIPGALLRTLEHLHTQAMSVSLPRIDLSLLAVWAQGCRIQAS